MHDVVKVCIPINETVVKPLLIDKLSRHAKKLLIIIARLYSVSGNIKYTINDFRSIDDYIDWKDTLGLFYELESRGLGTVSNDGGVTSIEMFKPLLSKVAKYNEIE